MLGFCGFAALPAVATIWIAHQQALQHQVTIAGDLAAGALAHFEQVGDQLAVASKAVNALPPAAACTPSGLATMRRMDLGSTLLQAVGHLDGNTIDCSSFAGPSRFDLGPPDYVSTRGVRTWTNVRFYGDQRSSYIAFGQGHFVGIVHKDLPLSYIAKIPRLEIGAFSWSNGKLMFARGGSSLARVVGAGHDEGVSRQGDRVVAIARSTKYDLGAVAALPIHKTALLWEATWLPVPPFILAAAIMAWLFAKAVRIRSAMPNQIRAAIRRGELRLHYQPVVDLETGLIVGAEALVRWERQRGEIILPDAFIPVAEECGVIGLITQSVLQMLQEDLCELRRVNPDLRVGVNFAASDMHDPRMAQRIADLMKRAKVRPGSLLVEATERGFMDADRARANIAVMREAGAQIAVDDFGTGYSNLSVLARLDVDCIKIDKLFVHALGTASVTRNVAARIIELATDLEASIIAEGIETLQQMDLLRGMGVRLGQGYLFGKPMPLDELIQRLRADRAIETARMPVFHAAQPAHNGQLDLARG